MYILNALCERLKRKLNLFRPKHVEAHFAKDKLKREIKTLFTLICYSTNFINVCIRIQTYVCLYMYFICCDRQFG